MPCQQFPKNQPPANFKAGPFDTEAECKEVIGQGACPCCLNSECPSPGGNFTITITDPENGDYDVVLSHYAACCFKECKDTVNDNGFCRNPDGSWTTNNYTACAQAAAGPNFEFAFAFDLCAECPIDDLNGGTDFCPAGFRCCQGLCVSQAEYEAGPGC